MEIVPGIFDGENLIVNHDERVPLSEITRGRLELRPYLLFPIETVNAAGELEECDCGILYPHTVEREYERYQLVYGEERSTRIYHLLEAEKQAIGRHTDIRHPHHVTTLGYRHLFLEMQDGSEIVVTIEGNCDHVPPQFTQLENGRTTVPLVAFFDRPSELANVIKKAGLEIYTN